MIKKENARGNFLIGLLLALNLIVSTIAISLHAILNNSNIVYVDAQRLVGGYQGMVDARSEFDFKSKTWKSNLDTLRIEFETKVKEYESTASQLSIKERSLLEELIQLKQKQFLSYQEVVSENVKHEDQDLTNKVLTKVNDFVKRYGEDKGYSIIMAATQFGNIIYADKQKDITDEVLRGLNAEYSN